MSPSTGTIIDLLFNALPRTGPPLRPFLFPIARNSRSLFQSSRNSPSDHMPALFCPHRGRGRLIPVLVTDPVARHQRSCAHNSQNISRYFRSLFSLRRLGIVWDFGFRYSSFRFTRAGAHDHKEIFPVESRTCSWHVTDKKPFGR
jgi:hypothetical protein